MFTIITTVIQLHIHDLTNHEQKQFEKAVNSAEAKWKMVGSLFNREFVAVNPNRLVLNNT